MLGDPPHPNMAQCAGGRWKFNEGDDGVMPDVQIVTYALDKLAVSFECTGFTEDYMFKTPMSIRESDQFPFWPQNTSRIEIYGTKRMMYLGRVAETADVDSIFHDARHPYTKALLRSIPKVAGGVRERLNSIRGMVPDPFNRPPGCVFHPRCDEFIPGVCDKKRPELVEVEPGHFVSCWAVTES